jgi:hypothetical protein
MGIHLSKERGKIKTFKVYVFVKLLNQNKTKDKTIRKCNYTKIIN